MAENGSNRASTVMQYVGQIQGTLEVLRDIIPTLATKDALEAVKKDLLDRLDGLQKSNEELRKRLIDMEVSASREGGKNGARWAIIVSIALILLKTVIDILMRG